VKELVEIYYFTENQHTTCYEPKNSKFDSII